MKTELDVHIGEIKIAKKGETLKAILGSCVGIAAIWKKNKTCILAHCLLPSSPAPNFKIGARFVDQAINSILAILKIKKSQYDEIEFIIVGGGNLTQSELKNNITQIGANNFNLATSMISKLGFKIIYSENGGDDGRKIFLDSEDFSFKVEKIPRLSFAS